MAPVKLDSPLKAFAAFVGMVLLGQAAIKVFKDKFKEAHNSFTTVGSLGSNACVTLFTRAKCRAKFKVCEKQNKMAALGFSRKSLVLASFRTVSRVKQFFKATASFPQPFTIEKNIYNHLSVTWLQNMMSMPRSIE